MAPADEDDAGRIHCRLDELLAAPVLGPYLASCRRPDGGYRFLPEVDCLAITTDGAPAWTAGS